MGRRREFSGANMSTGRQLGPVRAEWHSNALGSNGGWRLDNDSASWVGWEGGATDAARSSRRRRGRAGATSGATGRSPACARRYDGPSARPTPRA